MLKKYLRKFEPLRFQLEGFLVKYNILKGGDDYTAFIIVARSRTGSTLLEKLLNNHPNIQCEGELLNNLSGRKPEKIINSFFSKKNKQTYAAGYKVFYYHPNDGSSEEIWNIHLNKKNLKIIHLKRENILRTVLSKKIADKTKQWSIKNSSKRISIEDKRITLSIPESIEEFEKTRNWENEFDRKFINHEMLEVNYEELTSDPKSQLYKIFSFLNVDPKYDLNVPLKKQNSEPLSKILINYPQVKADLEKTKWKEFLCE